MINEQCNKRCEKIMKIVVLSCCFGSFASQYVPVISKKIIILLEGLEVSEQEVDMCQSLQITPQNM
jgi:hypothetical protein